MLSVDCRRHRSRHRHATATVAAAAVAAAATTAAAVAATAAAISAATARARTFLLLRPRFVHCHRSAAIILTVELVDCSLRFGVAAHLDEAEAFASACIAVRDELRRFNGAAHRELCSNVFFSRRERQIADVKFPAHETSKIVLGKPFKEESGTTPSGSMNGRQSALNIPQLFFVDTAGFLRFLQSRIHQGGADLARNSHGW